MALLGTDQVFVGAEQRLDGDPGKPTYWPRGYVRIVLDGHVVHVGPAVARRLAKHLVANANRIDPPTPRKKRT